MSRASRLIRDVCFGIALLTTAGCGGGHDSSTPTGTSTQTAADFDFGGNDPKKVTAFGDSLTEGVLELKRRGLGIRTLGLTTANNYPALLQGKLQALDSAWRVVNRGQGGEHTFQGVGRLPSTLGSDKPGFVLIMEGANDAEACLDTNVATNNLRNMVRIARSNRSIPIIGTITPSFRNNSCADDFISTVNNNIHGFASGEGVVVAEIFNGMNNPSLFGQAPDRDPLHPNEQGYRVMADIWFQAMLQAIPGGPTMALRRRR
jgi:acyl-CoA thioesterase-1